MPAAALSRPVSSLLCLTAAKALAVSSPWGLAKFMVVCGDWRGALGEQSGEERYGAQPNATVRGIKAGGIGTDCCGEGEEGGHDMVISCDEEGFKGWLVWTAELETRHKQSPQRNQRGGRVHLSAFGALTCG